MRQGEAQNHGDCKGVGATTQHSLFYFTVAIPRTYKQPFSFSFNASFNRSILFGECLPVFGSTIVFTSIPFPLSLPCLSVWLRLCSKCYKLKVGKKVEIKVWLYGKKKQQQLRGRRKVGKKQWKHSSALHSLQAKQRCLLIYVILYTEPRIQFEIHSAI